MLFFLVLVLILVYDNITNTKLVYGHRKHTPTKNRELVVIQLGWEKNQLLCR